MYFNKYFRTLYDEIKYVIYIIFLSSLRSRITNKPFASNDHLNLSSAVF